MNNGCLQTEARDIMVVCMLLALAHCVYVLVTWIKLKSDLIINACRRFRIYMNLRDNVLNQ